MPLLSFAEVLHVGYSNLYLLLGKSILTLFKVAFQASLFGDLMFPNEFYLRTIWLSLTPFDVQVRHMENLLLLFLALISVNLLSFLGMDRFWMHQYPV